MKPNSSHSRLVIALVLGVGLLAAPSVFAGDLVGEIVRDSVLLPLEAPVIIARALVSAPPAVVVEGQPDYYYWRRPAYYPAPGRYPGPGRYWGPGRYPSRGGYGHRPWGYRNR